MNKLLATVAIAAMLGGFVSMPEVAAQPQQPTREQVAEAEILAIRAKVKFEGRDYIAAAELFQKAYALSGTLGTLYNLARAKTEAGQLAEAKELFLLFIRKVNERKKVLDDESKLMIQDAERQLRRIEDKMNMPSAPPIVGEKVVPPVQRPMDATAITNEQPPVRSFNPAKLNGWKSYIAGGLAVGGASLMLAARSVSLDANARAPITSIKEREAYKADFATANKLWWTGLAATVVGAGFATWSAFDAFEEVPAAKVATSSLKVIPNVGPQGPGVVITGRF